MGKLWRTGEAIIGTKSGVHKSGTIRRVGGHRRWDAEGLSSVRGQPWKWDPDKDVPPKDLKIRWLTDEEKSKVAEEMQDGKVYRLRLRREDFFHHGFTEGCQGCKALLAGSPTRGHSELCRARMEKEIEKDSDGKARKEKQEEKENVHLEKILKRRFEKEGPETWEQEESVQKKPKTTKAEDVETGPSSSSHHSLKRNATEAEMDKPDDEMEITLVEKLMQEDMKWNQSLRSDMCTTEHPDMRRMELDMNYYGENSWEPLDAKLVVAAEKEEMTRFKKMQVYTYVNRQEAEMDDEGKFVKVKWVRVNKGCKMNPKIRCRLVAQELAYGERIDELFAGTPSLSSVKIALHLAAEGGCDYKLMVMDVKCAFLYGKMRRNIYIELPTQDERYGDKNLVGKLVKAMYGTRDAPQIWGDLVQETMTSLGMQSSMIQPSVYFHVSKKLVVVTHVDDFLCVGPEENLTWLFEGLSAKFEMTKTIVGQGHAHEVKYLNRFISWNNGVFTIEGDTKHRNILMKEWGMEQCSGVDTPLTRDGMEKVSCGELLDESEASKVRRAIARINYMALDRADLSSAARIASQYMSEPRQGTEIVVKRIIRYLQSYPRMPNHISKKSDQNAADSCFVQW